MIRLFVALLVSSLLTLPSSARTNVVFIIADDVSWDDLGCYGNPFARTPHIDQLAKQGRRFDQAYLTASSCSPSRSSIITGRYPHNMGRASELHQPISAHLPWFPRLMREAGYWTALVGKNHMTEAPAGEDGISQPQAFDLIDNGIVPGNKGAHGKWVDTLRNRPKDKPFFCWFASLDAHRVWEGNREWKEDLYGPKHEPDKVRVPVALVDDAATRTDLVSYYNEVTRWDYFVGQVVEELRSQNVLDDTLIVITADNGRAFPRAKTRLHDSGMKAILVAHWPKAIGDQAGPTNSMASAIDIAPTVLEAAGIVPAETMQGVSLVPILQQPTAQVRNAAFSEHNWHDYEAHGRAVRHGGYLYIRNHRPALPWQGPADSVKSPSHASLLAAQAAGAMTPAQREVLVAPRDAEELYLTAADPDQLNNLAGDPAHRAARDQLAAMLTDWMDKTGDDVPERLSPDTFDRKTGNRLPASNGEATELLPPVGASRNADRNNYSDARAAR
jgi:N-sulfoglucosamine sulfohydrolase